LTIVVGEEKACACGIP